MIPPLLGLVGFLAVYSAAAMLVPIAINKALGNGWPRFYSQRDILTAPVWLPVMVVRLLWAIVSRG